MSRTFPLDNDGRLAAFSATLAGRARRAEKRPVPAFLASAVDGIVEARDKEVFRARATCLLFPLPRVPPTPRACHLVAKLTPPTPIVESEPGV